MKYYTTRKYTTTLRVTSTERDVYSFRSILVRVKGGGVFNGTHSKTLFAEHSSIENYLNLKGCIRVDSVRPGSSRVVRKLFSQQDIDMFLS